jgi:hypothetical protein
MAKPGRKAQRNNAARQRQRKRRAKDRQLAANRRADNQTVEEAGKESFPASDPPASGLPDKPPGNADEKWKAARKARQRVNRRTTV